MTSNGDGKPGRCLIFWDYDTQWGADRSRSAGGPKTWGALDFENTERLLELHDEYRMPACFAVVGSAALPGSRPYHDPEQVRRIHAAGHEIGSHAFRHEWLPGLDREGLLSTLRRSKNALEQCIGGQVISFVPPYNQPFDFPARLSFSISERREAGPARSGLRRLCVALREAGYRFCRVAYRPMHLRVADLFLSQRAEQPSSIEDISGVSCVRLNTPGGFDWRTLNAVKRCAESGGLVVVYAHPHSLRAGNSQDESLAVPFFEQVRDLRRLGLLEVCLPRDLVVLD
jgi:hypothetical protein